MRDDSKVENKGGAGDPYPADRPPISGIKPVEDKPADATGDPVEETSDKAPATDASTREDGGADPEESEDD